MVINQTRTRRSLALLLVILLTSAPPLVARAQETDAEAALRERMVEIEQERQEEETKQKEAEAEAKKAEVESQRAAQEKAREKKQKGAQMAQMLGMGLTAAAALALIAAKATGNASLEEIGSYMMLGGMAANMVGGMMGANANAAGSNAVNLDNLDSGIGDIDDPVFSPDGTPRGNSSGSNAGNANAGTSQVALSPETLRNGELGNLLSQFEAETGITPLELQNALNAGVSPGDFLDGAGGLTKDEINASLAKAQESTNGGQFSQGALAKLAETAGLGSLAANLEGGESKLGDIGSADTVAFSGGGKGLQNGGASGSSGASRIAPLKFGTPAEEKSEEAGGELTFDFKRDVDPTIQRQLAAAGHIDGTIFQLVRSRYTVWSPLMLGYGPTTD